MSQKQHIAPRFEASESADKQSKKYLGSDSIIYSYEVISGLILNYFFVVLLLAFVDSVTLDCFQFISTTLNKVYILFISMIESEVMFNMFF